MRNRFAIRAALVTLGVLTIATAGASARRPSTLITIEAGASARRPSLVSTIAQDRVPQDDTAHRAGRRHLLDARQRDRPPARTPLTVAS